MAPQFALCELTPILLLEPHAEQPKRLSGCNATLLFELQREILGKFLLISSQISTFLVSTGVLSSHLVIYFFCSLIVKSLSQIGIVYQILQKTAGFQAFYGFFIYMKTQACLIVQDQVYPQISFYALFFVLFSKLSKDFQAHCRKYVVSLHNKIKMTMLKL